ncbi:MAG: phosphodiester glycosidase family protein [Roseiflexaceae bacterium]
MLQHDQISPTRRAAAPNPHPRRRGYHARTALGALILIVCGLSLWVYMSPALIPESVDLARALFGPGPVAQVEGWVFQAHDALRQAHYQATGTRNSVQWAAPAATLPPARPTAPRHAAPLPQPASPIPAATAIPAAPAPPDIWSPFVSTADGQAVLERAITEPDPSRPYVQAALVRIDLDRARLHLIAGTSEPRSPVRVPRPGRIPAAEQRPGYLLAAFNGGFKAINGDFGMAVNGVALLPPKAGLATLAIYRDGRIRLGVWGQDLLPTPDLLAYRQNCPPLLDGGKLTTQAEMDDPQLWGRTVRNKIATWRSGLGLSADGRYLIYAVGDGLTVPTLAQALASAGADRAMQLDINSYWTRFVTYAPTGNGGGLVAQKLLDQMFGDARQFLAPDSRDFFYITAG